MAKSFEPMMEWKLIEAMNTLQMQNRRESELSNRAQMLQYKD
jgi:hypothetical protein